MLWIRGTLALALAAATALPAAAQGAEPKEPPPEEQKDSPKEEGKDEGKEEKDYSGWGDPMKALEDGLKLSQEKKYTFTGGFDVEVAGSPMFALEFTGEHADKWTHFTGEMMGNKIDTYTDGTVTIALDPRSGDWRKQDGAGARGAVGMDQIAKAVKSGKWDGEAKVGSKACRVMKAKADEEELRKLIAGGRGGRGGGGRGGGLGQGEVKKSSLKFYLDAGDGRVRKMRFTMTVETNMGGNAMELDLIMDYRYKYSKDVKVELPEEVRALLEEKPEEPKEEGEKKPEESKEEPRDEGSGK
jgi:hypothetical protein